MAPGRASEVSLRWDSLETSRLARAFVFSVALHLLVWGSYTTGNKLGVWKRVHLPAWVQKITQTLAKAVKKDEVPQPRESEPPLMFVEVSPRQAAAEPPKAAAYYSDKNSQAANPDADKDTNVPKITGTQTQVVKTEDVPRTKAFPLQPAPAPPPAELIEQAKLAEQVKLIEPVKSKPAMAPGDLTLAKPEEMVRKEDGQSPQSRPRTIKEALARQQQYAGLSGEKMKQDGGVKRRAATAQFDVKGTPFGEYDAAIIAAVQNRWYHLLDSRDYARDRVGRVVLEFRLNYDGTIPLTYMKVVENTVDELLCLLCKKAILDPAPYEKWPSDMRRLVGADYREVRFTFYYN